MGRNRTARTWITGEEVRAIRTKVLRLTQEQVAELLDCSQSTVSAMERPDAITKGLTAHVFLCSTCRRHVFERGALLKGRDA